MSPRYQASLSLASASLALVFSLGGCAYGELRTVLRAQFASELNCPEVKIVKRELWYVAEGPDQYKISGCGVLRTYTCPDPGGLVSYDEPQCSWVEGDADAPTANAPKQADPVDDSAGGEDADADDASDTDEANEGADAAEAEDPEAD
ncbi:MAG: hypothetical protein OEZ06_07585 [Myxococcales bacterium]|nr:hypothetical protein [Myxococcales bacterium]